MKKTVKRLFILLSLNCLYLLYAVIVQKEIHYLISPLLINTGTFSLILHYYIKKISRIIIQFGDAKEQNKKLLHTIARLKHSNDQSRRLIIQKDLDLFQMARHASLAEVTTGIAHELSQPLTGIKGMAQNMIDDLTEEDFDRLQAVSELLKISLMVDKSSSIIDHIRNFSRKAAFSMKLINLNNVIKDAIDLVNYQLIKNKIELVLEFDENLEKINGDKISLEQLIVNFILNGKDAIIEKFSDKENKEGNITIATKMSQKQVRLIISDNGIGISNDIIHKIWSPFFTTKTRNQGTGIGLSISNKIIKEHNAESEIHTSKNGTTFIISFPAQQDRRN